MIDYRDTVMKIEFTPIGIIHSPYKEPEGTPIQGVISKNTQGKIEIYPEYTEGLKDLDKDQTHADGRFDKINN